MAAWPYCTSQWQQIRLLQLQKEPLCRYCGELGHISPARHVDHIIPVRDRPDLAFSMDNLQCLCAHCHNSVKQAEEATGTRIGASTSGAPLDPKHHWNAEAGGEKRFLASRLRDRRG
ncbi:MAG: HNH endonuclease [Pigmentiphaga sp.]